MRRLAALRMTPGDVAGVSSGGVHGFDFRVRAVNPFLLFVVGAGTVGVGSVSVPHFMRGCAQ